MYRYFSILAILALVYTIYAHESLFTPTQPAPIEMTPQQLDDSLHIDKKDLDLDNALGIDLGAEIESLAAISEPLPVSSESKEYAPNKPAPGSKPMPAAPIIVSPMRTSLNTAQPTMPVMTPEKAAAEEAKIEFQFEDADLQNLLTQMSELFDVTFITDDAISPLPKNGKSLKGNKITFKTNKPLTKPQAWDLFLTFLDVIGMAIVPEAEPSVLRIMQTANAQKAPIPTYIGIRPNMLPDTDQLIRYLYFVENSSLDTIKTIVNALRSSASALLELKDHNAFVITDKAINIKSLMTIVTELDQATMPQSMSVLKLKRANAEDVQKLYTSLVSAEETGITARLFPGRKATTSVYFPDDTHIIAEPRTNALILLGQQDSIKKIEEFILRYVDVELGEEMLSPLRVYPLKYADAQTVAAIMNETVQFGKNTVAGKTGGVRDGDKYIKSLTFIAEPSTNKLIIKGDEEDYLQAKEILAKLDEPQPQVAIEILILTIDLSSGKELGTQLRSKNGGISTGLFGPNVKFQTSNINNIIVNPLGVGVQRLLGNLLTLITEPSTTIGTGNTVVTFGSDSNGVWGIFNALDTITNAQVVSNPFLVATNKQTATVSVGENRRVVTNQVITGAVPTNSLSDLIAALTVKVTPQINSDGMIVLDLDITINDFTDIVNQSDATMTKKNVTTRTIVADKEVLALGGLIKNTINNTITKTPLLANIPILGWFFKDHSKSQVKENLLILISSQILPPETPQRFTDMTQERIRDYYGTMDEMKDVVARRDPIHRAFFAERPQTTEQLVEDYIFERHTAPEDAAKSKKAKRKAKKQKNNAQPTTTTLARTNPVITPQAPAQPVQPVQPAPIQSPSSTAQRPQQQPDNKKIARARGKQSLTDFLGTPTSEGSVA